MSRFKKDYVAVDGTVCQTVEEMLQINRRVYLILLPEKIEAKFGFLIKSEKSEWFGHNISRRGLPLILSPLEKIQRWLKE